MVKRSPKMPSPKTSCSPKIKTTRKTNSPSAKPFYPSRDRVQNNMQMALKNMGFTTAHTKRGVKKLWHEIHYRFGHIISNSFLAGKNISKHFSVAHKELTILISKEAIINKAEYSDDYKCACLGCRGVRVGPS